MSRQTSLVHRLRTSPPETRPLASLVPDHVVVSAQVMAHPNSVPENVHVARPVFVRPFTEKGVRIVIVLSVWCMCRFDGGRVVVDERLCACRFP